MPSSKHAGASQSHHKGDGLAAEWLDDSGQSDRARSEPSADSFSRTKPASLKTNGRADVLPNPSQLVDGIKDAAASTAEAVKAQASAVASEVGHELGKTAGKHVARGADAMRGFARAIDAASSELEEQSPQLARYAADTADKIRDVSDDLASHDVNDLIGTATDLAKAQPALFFGAAVFAGFAFARFMKSSAVSGGSSATRYSGDLGRE